jgi:hypothetical protein
MVSGRRADMTTAEIITKTVEAGKTPAPFGRTDGYPLYATNLNRAMCLPPGHKHSGCNETNCCVYCGKVALTPHKSPKLVSEKAHFCCFLDSCGNWIEAEGSDDNDILGFYPLGPDCARRLKKIVPVYEVGTEHAYGGIEDWRRV